MERLNFAKTSRNSISGEESELFTFPLITKWNPPYDLRTLARRRCCMESSGALLVITFLYFHVDSWWGCWEV